MMQRNLEDMTLRELVSLIGNSPKMERKAAEREEPVLSTPSPPIGNRLIPVTEWSKHHSWPPLGGLRWLIFNEHSNGFHKVVRRVGRRVLIDEAAFFEWVRQGNGSQLAPVIPAGQGRPRRAR